MESSDNQGGVIKEKPKVVVWIRRVFWSILMVMAIIFVLLQFTSVQTYLISKVTKYLSEITNTKVTVERLSLNPLDGIVLQNFDIIEPNNDTIFHAGAVSVSLRRNFF